MGRHKTMTKEDKQQYCRDYYYKTKDERLHEYELVSKRAYLRRKIKELGDANPEKIAELEKKIEVINAELEPIRRARWEAKRAAGKAKFKHFDDDETVRQVINETPIAIQ